MLRFPALKEGRELTAAIALLGSGLVAIDRGLGSLSALAMWAKMATAATGTNLFGTFLGEIDFADGRSRRLRRPSSFREATRPESASKLTLGQTSNHK